MPTAGQSAAAVAVIASAPDVHACVGCVGCGLCVGQRNSWVAALLSRLASWPLVIVFVFMAVVLVYYLAPSVSQRWRDIVPGATFAV